MDVIGLIIKTALKDLTLLITKTVFQNLIHKAGSRFIQSLKTQSIFQKHELFQLYDNDGSFFWHQQFEEKKYHIK